MVLHLTYEEWDLWQATRHSAHVQQSEQQQKICYLNPPQKQLCSRTGICLQGSHCACCFAEQKQYQQLLKHEEGTQPNTKHQNIGRVRFGTILTQDVVLSSTLNGIKIIRTFWFLQASFAFMFLITCLGLESSKGMPFNLACSSYSPSLKKSPTAYMNRSQKEHSACSTRSRSSQSLRLWVNVAEFLP